MWSPVDATNLVADDTNNAGRLRRDTVLATTRASVRTAPLVATLTGT
jgi:hypothetical protein